MKRTPEQEANLRRLDRQLYHIDKLDGRHVRIVRRRAGWTQQQLADYWGMSLAWVGQTERGELHPDRRTRACIVILSKELRWLRLYGRHSQPIFAENWPVGTTPRR